MLRAEALRRCAARLVGQPVVPRRCRHSKRTVRKAQASMCSFAKVYAHTAPVSRPTGPRSGQLPHKLTPRANTGATTEVEMADFKAQVEGKRFKCTQCGKCCTGPGEDVSRLDATQAER